MMFIVRTVGGRCAIKLPRPRVKQRSLLASLGIVSGAEAVRFQQCWRKPLPECNSLRGRLSLHRRQQDQCDADQDEHSYANQLSACDEIAECLEAHQRGVGEA